MSSKNEDTQNQKKEKDGRDQYKGSYYLGKNLEEGTVQAKAIRKFAGSIDLDVTKLIRTFFSKPLASIALSSRMMRNQDLQDLVFDEDTGMSGDITKWDDDNVEDLARLKPFTDMGYAEAIRRGILKDGKYGRIIKGIWKERD